MGIDLFTEPGVETGDPFDFSPNVCDRGPRPQPAEIDAARSFRSARDIQAQTGKLVGLDPEQESSPKVDRSQAAKKRKAQERYLHKLTRELYVSWGYFEWRCDRTIVTTYGSIITQDLMGIGDRLAIRKDAGGIRLVLVQITVKDQVRAHVLKMANPKTRVKFEDEPEASVRELAIRWWAVGGEIEIVGWEKVGSRWVHAITRVTSEMFEEADRRRRT